MFYGLLKNRIKTICHKGGLHIVDLFPILRSLNPRKKWIKRVTNFFSKSSASVTNTKEKLEVHECLPNDISLGERTFSDLFNKN